MTRSGGDGRPLPGFVGLGALKAGTTFLDGLLRRHPQLCLPRGLKEVDYFTVHYGRGSRWYASRFDGCATRLHGEVSPRYLVDPRVPERLVRANPGARLLLVARDPVERAYSQYKHRVRTTAAREDFDAYLAANHGVLERGRYFAHLGGYLDRFPREALHVVLFDDLVDDSAAALGPVWRLLGVDDLTLPPRAEDSTEHNDSWQPSRRRLYAAAKAVSRGLHRAGLGRVASTVSGSSAADVLAGQREPMSVAPMSATTAQRLRAYYLDDVVALSALLGRDLIRLWWAADRERVT
jgi:hypothetical protein